jgi:DNA-binding HxlR family transcriptional regulator
MALLDLLGRRWALRVLWELALRPRQTFRELQAACGDISASVLRDRLRELREAGIVERTDPGYALSRSGTELVRTLDPLNRWAHRWASLLEEA